MLEQILYRGRTFLFFASGIAAVVLLGWRTVAWQDPEYSLVPNAMCMLMAFCLTMTLVAVGCGKAEDDREV